MSKLDKISNPTKINHLLSKNKKSDYLYDLPPLNIKPIVPIGKPKKVNQSKSYITDYCFIRLSVGSLKTSLDSVIENSDDIQIRESDNKTILNKEVDKKSLFFIEHTKKLKPLHPQDKIKADKINNKMIKYFVKISPHKAKINLELFAMYLLVGRFREERKYKIDNEYNY